MKLLDDATGILSVNKSVKLTPRQVYTIKNMHSDDKNAYVLSLLGLSTKRIYIDKRKPWRGDMLASKSKGSILREMKTLQNLDINHLPTDKCLGQWIGVELECIIPHQDGNSDCSGDCDEDGCICRTDVWSEDEAHNWLRDELKSAGVTRVSVKEDGSLADDGGYGVECTIVFNTAYGFGPLEKLCNALQKAGCYVNKTCGMHVHLDVRGKDISEVNKIGRSLEHALPVIRYMVPESRQENSYCRLRMSEPVLRSKNRHNCGGRYFAINMTAWYRFKTIEVRLHQGSLNASKIKNWIELLRVIEDAKLKTDITSFQELIELPGMTEELVKYADKRITELNPDAWSLLMRDEAQLQMGA